MIKIIPSYKDMDRYTFEVRVLNVQMCIKIRLREINYFMKKVSRKIERFKKLLNT